MAVALGMSTASSLLSLGVVLHIFYFRPYEHHMYAVRYIQTVIFTYALVVAMLFQVYDYALFQAISLALQSYTYFFTGVFASLITYRIFLHPLAKFPGPLPARISTLWFSSQVHSGNAPQKMVELNRQYGPFVRIGSSDLAIMHPLGVPAVYGQESKCRKSSWYDEPSPFRSLQNTRDHDVHQKLRRIWSPAFSDKALRGYETRVTRCTDNLLSKLSQANGRPLNVSQWFNWWSFDIMGELSFNKDFGMLENGKPHWAIAILTDRMAGHRPKLPSWLVRILVAIPYLNKDFWAFADYCDSQLYDRMKIEPEHPDIMSTLLPGLKLNDKDFTISSLRTDSQLIIVAGSDTTASTLVHLFYELVRHPEHIEKIRNEVTSLIGSDTRVTNQKVYKAEHLNAVINETLRLYPPVPTILPRKTPPEGITVGDTFVPGNMIVHCPQYALARSEDIYENAVEFIPERWTTKPNMIKFKEAYAPFSSGAYNCIGRPLALMELRLVVSEILLKFDVSIAPGETGKRLIQETKDQFVLSLGGLDLCFKERGA